MKQYLSHQPLLKANFCKHSGHKEHSHSDHSHFDARRDDKRILVISLLMTGSMMVVQFIYSLLSNSLALLSDTLHMFSDVFALALSFLAILAVQKFKSEQKTFGYFRLEILVAFINALTIILSAIFIVIEAIDKLFNPSAIDAKTMLIVAFAGLLVNAFNAFLMYKGANLDNVNIKSAFLHMISDLLGSVAVIIGGILVYYTGFVYIDTILALLLSLLLLRWAVILLKQSVHILLEGSPVDVVKVKTLLLDQKEIVEVIDLHIYQITEKMLVASMHLKLRCENLGDFEEIARKISQKLLDEFEIGHCTIQPLGVKNAV